MRLAAFGTFLLSPLGLKIGLAAAVAIGGYGWYRGQIREAEQRAVAEEATESLKTLEKQHEQDTKRYQERVTELEQRVVDLARNRAASVQKIEVITKEAETQRNEVQNLDVSGVRAAIRQRLLVSAATTANAR